MSLQTDCSTNYNQIGDERQIPSNCKTCSVWKLCSDTFKIPNETLDDIEDIDLKIHGKKRIILVTSGIEGAGKTTIASNLAILLSNEGFKVGIIDFDVTSQLRPNIISKSDIEFKMIPWKWSPLKDSNRAIIIKSITSCSLKNNDPDNQFTINHKTNIIHEIFGDNYWDDLDYLLCDLSSGTREDNFVLMRYFRIVKPDGAVVVTRQTESFLEPTENIINCIKHFNIRILGIIENMIQSACTTCPTKINSEESQQIKKIAKNNQVFYLGGIQYNTRLVEDVQLTSEDMVQNDRNKNEIFFQNYLDILRRLHKILDTHFK